MLARTFVRLCALEALRPSAKLASDGPWPTLGKAYVYDSRLDPMDDVAETERRPVVAVYTEENDLERIAQAGPLFYRSAVNLVFEASVIATDRDDEASPFVPGIAITDAELEASLDVFEDQIFHALHYGPSGALFRRMVKMPFLSWQSHPLRASQEAVRLAARTIRARIDIKEFCYAAAPASPQQGLDRLPSGLKEIAAALDGSTYLASIAAGVAVAAPTMPTRLPLESVGVTVDPRTSATPAEAVTEIVTNVTNLQD